MMRRTWIIAALLGSSILAIAFLAGVFMYLVTAEGGGKSLFSSDRGIGILKIEGPILSSDRAIEDIKEFGENKSVKGILLRVDSPGGAVAASQEIYEALLDLSQKKPVVASMGSVAASGGYYVSLAADEIWANPGTTTGSIGVRLEHVMIGDLLEWMKIKHETLKSGALKDLVPMDRPISPEAREILEKMLAEIHAQFKGAVAERRKLELPTVDKIADGRIFTGAAAKDLKLVDEIGGVASALKRLSLLAKIEGEPELIFPRKRGRLIDRIFTEIKSRMSSLAIADYWQPMVMMRMDGLSER
jgi:protease-4